MVAQNVIINWSLVVVCLVTNSKQRRKERENVQPNRSKFNKNRDKLTRYVNWRRINVQEAN